MTNRHLLPLPVTLALSLALTLTLTLTLSACGDSTDSSPSDDGGTTDWGTWYDSTTSDGGSSDGGSSDGGSTSGTTSGTVDDETDPGEDTDPDAECDDKTPVSLWISPDDSNSMSSPVQIRGAALDGYGTVYSAPVRTWELFNYYDFAYPAAPAGDLVVTAAAVATDEEGTWTLQIGVSSETLAKADREPMNLALSIDTSGSMGGRPITLTREIGRAIAGNLREGDVLSIVTWSSSNSVELSGYTVDGPDDPVVLAVIDDLYASGSTNLNAGLVAAYNLVADHYDDSRTNRVVLISDGGANAGVTDKDLIASYAGEEGEEGEEGIYLVGVGVSDEGAYNDVLMDSVTDAGRGASIFVYDSDEVDRVFGERFVNTMEVAARDVQLNLNMPAGFEMVRYSAEEVSTDPSEVDPQNIAPNDTMVFHQTIRSCAPDEVTEDDRFEIQVEYRDAVTWEAKVATLDLSLGELLDEDSSLLLKGAALMTYADAIKALHGDPGLPPWSEAGPAALDAIDLALEHNPGDSDLAELRDVIEAL